MMNHHGDVLGMASLINLCIHSGFIFTGVIKPVKSGVIAILQPRLSATEATVLCNKNHIYGGMPRLWANKKPSLHK